MKPLRKTGNAEAVHSVGYLREFEEELGDTLWYLDRYCAAGLGIHQID